MFDDKQIFSTEYDSQDTIKHEQSLFTYRFARFVLLECSAQKYSRYNSMALPLVRVVSCVDSVSSEVRESSAVITWCCRPIVRCRSLSARPFRHAGGSWGRLAQTSTWLRNGCQLFDDASSAVWRMQLPTTKTRSSYPERSYCTNKTHQGRFCWARIEGWMFKLRYGPGKSLARSMQEASFKGTQNKYKEQKDTGENCIMWLWLTIDMKQ